MVREVTRLWRTILQEKEVGSNSKYCMMGYEVRHTLSDFGSVSRGVCESKDADFLSSVVERTKILKDGESIYYVDEKKKHIFLERE